MAERAIGDDAPAIAFALVTDREIVFEGGVGFADRELELAADEHTVFRVGSISKLMTAISIMQLVERGEVELDAPLRRYLPEFELGEPLLDSEGWSMDDITIRRILTHHSGLPSDHFHEFFSSGSHYFHEIPDLLANENAAARVDQVFSYSNLGFGLLGLVVERVTDVPFADYVDRNLFEPAGMSSTSFELTDELNSRLANGTAKGKRQRYVRIGAVPAGSLYSSVHDLALFARLILNGGAGPSGRVLQEETLGMMWRPQYDELAMDIGFSIGLAWFIEPLRGVGPVVGHDGGTAYFASRLMISREHNLAAIALVNSTDAGDVHPRRVVDRTLQLATQALTAVSIVDVPALSPFAPTISEETVKRYEGHYQTIVGHMRIEASGTSLYGSLFGQPIEFRPTERKNFGGRLWLFGILPLRVGPFGTFEFSFTEVGEVVVFGLERGGARWAPGGTRIEPVEPHGVWRDRIGRYELLNPTDDVFFDSIGLAEHEGALVLELHGPRLPGPQNMALRPLDDERAVILGLGRNSGGVVRYRDDELQYSGFRARRISEQ